ncbi:uncharacterized protein CDV56_103216 [Aspergillus thermomutatus]|uniref:Uncharacterized protein n=1 Tax=Aspergillus thermomutatus TaxID=41047 RepID=A0A397G5J3_ASPTH|nr:uncharacterized protein CDV56_103216 [Aspergillus thermomutatus]RHZ46255.1 hypothetical protein CDV56_103216 [Aspergillus thermomutatus]
MSSNGMSSNIYQRISSFTTKEPATHSRVPQGEVRSVSSPSRAPSVATDASRVMSPAEIRMARQRKVAPVTEAPVPAPHTPGQATPATESAADTASQVTPTTPLKASSVRAQRLASRSRASPASATRGSAVSDIPRLTDGEASAMTIMAEYMSNTRDDADASSFAEQLMACVELREARSGAGADALKAVCADASKDAKPVVPVPSAPVAWDDDTVKSLDVVFAPIGDNTNEFTRDEIRTKVPRRYFDIKLSFQWDGQESVYLKADDSVIHYVPPRPPRGNRGKSAVPVNNYGISRVVHSMARVLSTGNSLALRSLLRLGLPPPPPLHPIAPVLQDETENLYSNGQASHVLLPP